MQEGLLKVMSMHCMHFQVPEKDWREITSFGKNGKFMGFLCTLCSNFLEHETIFDWCSEYKQKILLRNTAGAHYEYVVIEKAP